MTRDGRASAGAPVAAAVATATRSANRASYSASVLRSPGQLPRGEVVPDDDVGVEPDHAAVPAERLAGPGGAQPAASQHPVQVGQPQQVARLGARLACGSGAARRGHGSPAAAR